MANTKVYGEQIVDGSITAAKLADGTIVAAELADNAVVEDAINADAVTGAKIADNAIDSEHYTDGSIDTAHIAASQITVAKMAANSIDSDQYVDGSIDTAHIADAQVTLAKIADGNISTAKLADLSVTSGKLATNLDLAGTLDVTGATTLDAGLTVDTTTLVVDASNNRVGIGITPTHNFNLSAAGAVEARFASTNNDCYLQISSDTDEGQSSILQFMSGTSARGSITYDHNTTAASQAMILKSGDNAVSAMTILGDGKVGIGATSVDEILHVEKSAGTTLIKTEVAANSVVGFEIKKTNATTSNWRIVDGQTVNGDLEIYDVTDSRLLTSFNGAGNVKFTGLVGINKPQNDSVGLSVGSDAASATSYGLEVCNNNSNTRFLVDGLGSQRFYGSGNAETARFTDGKLGIGLVAPQQLLHTHIASSSGAYHQFTNSSTGSASGDGWLVGIADDENFIIWGQESTESFRIYNNGAYRFTVDHNGAVTIGGTLGVTGAITGTLATAAQTAITSVGTLTGLAVNSGGANVVASFTSTDSIGAIQLVDNGGNVEIGAVGNDFHVMNAGGAAHMIVENSGRITIGNNLPMWSGAYGGALFLKGNNATSDRHAELTTVDSNGATTGTGLVVKGAGAAINVGIGTASPTNTLDLGASTAGRALTFAKYSNLFSEHSNGSLWLSSNFYGNAGASGYKTSVTGNYGAAGIRMHGTGGGSTSGLMQFFVDTNASKSADADFTPTERMRIASNGRQTVNGSTTANAHATFVGEVGASMKALAFERTNGGGEVGTIVTNASSTSYNTSSDYRLKENVDYTWDATTRLKQLKPARFNWIADDTNTLLEGFLAHEVYSIVPEAVSGEKDAMTDPTLYIEGEELPEGKSVGDIKIASVPDHQGIDQSKLVPLLVKTIQELEARITALEG